MIQSISRFTNFNARINNNTACERNNNAAKFNSINADTVSFTGGAKGVKFVEEGILSMLQKLEAEPPVIGFKGEGKWLLPNLRYNAGKRFNLYMPGGEQLSLQKGDFNDSMIFSYKKCHGEGNSHSKINLPQHDLNNEGKKLLKTKMDKILTFRVNTQDSRFYDSGFKAGQIDLITKNADGSYSETTNLSDGEYKKINNLLQELLPSFF